MAEPMSPERARQAAELLMDKYGMSEQEAVSHVWKLIQQKKRRQADSPFGESMPNIPEDVFNAADTASKATGVPLALTLAFAQTEQESFDPTATSKAGAVGNMQVMPDTFKAFGKGDINNVNDNFGAGANYISHLYTRYSPNIDLVIAGYNAGETKLNDAILLNPGTPKAIDSLGLTDYVSKVKKRYQRNLKMAQDGVAYPVGDPISPGVGPTPVPKTPPPSPEAIVEAARSTKPITQIGPASKGVVPDGFALADEFDGKAGQYTGPGGTSGSLVMAAQLVAERGLGVGDAIGEAVNRWWNYAVPEFKLIQHDAENLRVDSAARDAFFEQRKAELRRQGMNPLKAGMAAFDAAYGDIPMGGQPSVEMVSASPLMLRGKKWVEGFVEMSSDWEHGVAEAVSNQLQTFGVPGLPGAAGVPVPEGVADTIGDVIGIGVRPDYYAAAFIAILGWKMIGPTKTTQMLKGMGMGATISALLDKFLVRSLHGLMFASSLAAVDAIEAQNMGEDVNKAFNESLLMFFAFDMALGGIGAGAAQWKQWKFLQSQTFSEARKYPALTKEIEKLSGEYIVSNSEFKLAKQALLAELERERLTEMVNKIYIANYDNFVRSGLFSGDQIRNAAAEWLTRFTEANQGSPEIAALTRNYSEVLQRLVGDMEGLVARRRAVAAEMQATRLSEAQAAAAASTAAAEEYVLNIPPKVRNLKDLTADELNRFLSTKTAKGRRAALRKLSPKEKKKIVNRANASRIGKVQRNLNAAAERLVFEAETSDGRTITFKPSTAAITEIVRKLRQKAGPGKKVTEADVQKVLETQLNEEFGKLDTRAGRRAVARRAEARVRGTNKEGTTAREITGKEATEGKGKVVARPLAHVEPDPVSIRFADDVHSLLQQNAAMAYSLRHGSVLGRDGFLVPFWSARNKAFSGVATKEDIAKYITKNADLLDEEQFVLQAYYDHKADKTFMSVLLHTGDLAHAKSIGQRGGIHGRIYDTLHHRSLPLYGEGAAVGELTSPEALAKEILMHAEKNPAVGVKFERYSPVKGLTEMTPSDVRSMQGHPLGSSESTTAAYLNGAAPESVLIGNAPYRYTGAINKARLYDTMKDPEGIVKRAVEKAKAGADLNTVLEDDIRRAGYSGVYDTSNPLGAILFFDSVPIREMARGQDPNLLNRLLGPHSAAAPRTGLGQLGEAVRGEVPQIFSKEAESPRLQKRITALAEGGELGKRRHGGRPSRRESVLRERVIETQSSEDIQKVNQLLTALEHGEKVNFAGTTVAEELGIKRPMIPKIQKVLDLWSGGWIDKSRRDFLLSRVIKTEGKGSFDDVTLFTMVDNAWTKGRINSPASDQLYTMIEKGEINSTDRLKEWIRVMPGREFEQYRDLALRKINNANLHPAIQERLGMELSGASSNEEVVGILEKLRVILAPDALREMELRTKILNEMGLKGLNPTRHRIGG